MRPPYTGTASRDAVEKLRLDGTPTPRSRVARMTKRSTPTGDGKSASRSGGPTVREYCNASESFLRVVWPRPPHALDPGEEIARGRAADHQSEGRCRHTDGRVEIEGDDLKLTLWYHDPDHLRSALCFGGRAEWKPKYHVLYVISSGSFNLATLNKVEPCKPPIRRRPTETTRQFIERAMRENHGYTVPARWLADLDAIPDGDTGEPESGYLVGFETPHGSNAVGATATQTTDARTHRRRHAIRGEGQQ
jgi:hypothetical protein